MTAATVVVVLGGLTAAFGSLALAVRLGAHGDSSGARWLRVALASQAVFCTAAAGGVLATDAGVRRTLELVSWVGLAGLGVPFLGFALAYSGRRHVVDHPAFTALLGVPVGGAALALTNPLHGLVFRQFAVESARELATATYQLGPAGILVVVTGFAAVSLGAVVLLDVAATYELYRAEAVAVAVSTVPPGVALTAWFAGIDPWTHLSVVPLFFLPHVAVDAYAIYRTDIFEFTPATQRAADAAAIDGLDSPVVVVNGDRRVVSLNDAARETFDAPGDAALKRRVDEVVGTTLSLDDGDPATISVRCDTATRHFAVTASAQTDPTGARVGHTVVFQDVTERRRRERRLDVLNRVLRHNIRNDLNVVVGSVQTARAADGDHDELLAQAETAATELASLADDVRDFDQLVDGVATREAVAVRDVIEDAGADAPVAVDAAVPPDLAVEASPDLLATTVGNLLDAMGAHVDSVAVEASDADGDRVALAFRASDELPQNELTPVRADRPGDVRHAAGLDLWVVRWGVELLGGRVAFETDDRTVGRIYLAEAPG